MLDQLGRAPDLVILPVGGGGLASGVTGYLREVAPRTDYRFVEPLGRRQPDRRAGGRCAGDAAAGEQLCRWCGGGADRATTTLPRLDWVRPEQVLLAPEDRICVTMLEMLNVEGIVLEPAGALSVDVLPELADEIRGKTVVCVTSGGNFDFRTPARGEGTRPALFRAEEILHPAHAAAPRCAARIPDRCLARMTTSPGSNT